MTTAIRGLTPALEELSKVSRTILTRSFISTPRNFDDVILPMIPSV
jgi:hypothetical protein